MLFEVSSTNTTGTPLSRLSMTTTLEIRVEKNIKANNSCFYYLQSFIAFTFLNFLGSHCSILFSGVTTKSDLHGILTGGGWGVR